MIEAGLVVRPAVPGRGGRPPRARNICGVSQTANGATATDSRDDSGALKGAGVSVGADTALVPKRL